MVSILFQFEFFHFSWNLYEHNAFWNFMLFFWCWHYYFVVVAGSILVWTETHYLFHNKYFNFLIDHAEGSDNKADGVTVFSIPFVIAGGVTDCKYNSIASKPERSSILLIPLPLWLVEPPQLLLPTNILLSCRLFPCYLQLQTAACTLPR